MRVLHVIPSIAPRLGGPSVGTIQMCQALARQGIEVSLFTNDLSEVHWSPFNPPPSSGVPLGRPVRLFGVDVWYFRPNWPYRFAFSRQMALTLARSVGQFDLVHIHTLYLFPSLAAAHYARKYRVPYIIQPHGALAPYIRRRHRRLKSVYSFLAERRNLNLARGIHFASETEMEQAQDLGIKAQGLVVPLGVNPSEFAQLPPRGCFAQRHPELRDKQLVVFLGRLAPKKGLDLLVEAFGVLAATFPKAHLVIAGPDDQGLGSKASAQLQLLGLASRATLPGMLVGEEKLSLLSDTDVWVLPSYDENFGIAVIEALASGLPVVISDRVNIHRQIRAAEAGLVVPCDASALAVAIAKVLSDQRLAMTLGARGKRLVEQEFTWDVGAKKLVAAYVRWVAVDEQSGAAALV